MLVQRVLSARSLDHGRKGMFLAGALMVLTLYIFIFPGVWAQYLFPGLENPDQVYPKLIKELMPVGLIGIIIASLIAALASSFSAVINSASTIFTMDFYAKISGEKDAGKLVKAGQVSAMIIVIIASLWAPHIHQFGTLVKYYQTMVSYIAPPVVCVFFLGVFWKRATPTGAFAGLLGGLAVAILLLVFKDQTFMANMHFLIMVPFILGASMSITVITSLMTKPSPPEVIEELVWKKRLFMKESIYLENLAWYNNYRVLSLLLIAFCAFFAAMYW